MKLKLFLLLSLFVSLPMLGQKSGVRGVVIDSQSGRPIADATVLLDAQGLSATTGPSGEFIINGARPGRDNLLVIGYGFKDALQIIELKDGVTGDVGSIRVQMNDFANDREENSSYGENMLTESELVDEEGSSQSIATLTGASDNPFYQAASYDFSIMRFRIRGYESQYSTTSINGIPFNEPVRGMFSYSMTGGMSHAFRNKSVSLGLESNNYGFGNIGGLTNINTFAKDYAPGIRASVAYTNSNYKYRGMVTYSSGVTKRGWAVVASLVGRYANEGVVPGTFYNSWGYFLSLQKIFNPQHSLSLTTFGAPTKRATNGWTVLEAYDLTGNNLYNPNWGWSDGKKRSKKVVESFSPAVLLNWVWTPKMGTTLNTGVAFQKSFYNSSDFNRGNNLADPRPDYYKYMPSYMDGYYHSPEITDLYTRLWQTDESVSQINWDKIYLSNYLNNVEAQRTGKERSANYILEKRHSNYAMWNFASTINHRINNWWVLNGGLTFNYTVSSYYKTVKDLLGGAYWSDYDTFAERDYPDNPSIAENDLNNPNRKVYKNDRFGYDYNILSLKAGIWKQFVFNLPKWDIYYTLSATYSTFQREGFMRNGRAPENSFGKGSTHEFINVAFKAGATYKLNGRNSFTGHIYYGTQPPLANNAYVSPRTKDDVIINLNSEKIFSADLSYALNYRIFRGYVSAFFTDMRNGTERTIFYDDEYSTSINYALTGVHRVHKGVEVGASIKLTPSITLNAAANIARYQYKNRPMGIKNLENGAQPDVMKQVYLKNFYVAGTPQEAYSVSINWNAPHQWYFTLKGTWLNRSYVQLSYVRHEEMPDLWTKYNTEAELEDALRQISTQEKLNEAFVVGASIGHSFRIHRIPFSINVNIDNLLNNKNIMTSGMQQGRFDRQEYTTTKWPNKYYFAQGFKIFINLSVRL